LKKLNHFFIKEPLWRPVEQARCFSIPAPVKDWLQEPGSLTHRIKKSFQGEFGVVVEGEAIAKPFQSDADVLNISMHQLSFVREVTLTTSAQPCVFARTTVLLNSLQSLQKLTHLGAKPLGEVIFSYYDLQRIRLDIAKISRSELSPKGVSLIGDSASLWARRNTYLIAGHALIVCEFFIPNMFPEFFE
jgi:chorismate--pyruvate lyase